MDCDSSGGCDGSGCSHSDCSYCNFHLTFLYNANVQERYVGMLVIVHATYQNVMSLCMSSSSNFQSTQTDSTHMSTVIQQRDNSRSGL